VTGIGETVIAIGYALSEFRNSVTKGVVSGINLGLTGVLGNNIGMSITSNQFVFIIVGLLYLATAYHLQQRWNTSGQKIF